MRPGKLFTCTTGLETHERRAESPTTLDSGLSKNESGNCVPLGMVTSFPCMRRKTGATGQRIKLVATMPSRSLRKKAEDFQVRYEHFHFFQNEQELLDLRPAHSLEIVWLKGLVCASKKSR